MPKRRKVTREQVVRARELRRNASVAEQVFWKICRNHKLGFEIRRQHELDGVTLDFYCQEAALAIEFDGEQHDPEQDSRRDDFVRERGIETMRIPNRDFFMIEASNEPRKDWIEAIIQRLEERSGRKVER